MNSYFFSRIGIFTFVRQDVETFSGLSFLARIKDSFINPSFRT